MIKSDNMCSLIEIKQLVKFLDDVKSLGIVATDSEGVIVYSNKTFQTLFGYSEEELLGNKTSILKSGFYSTEFYKEMWDTIKSGKVYSNLICNKKKDGKDVWEYLTIIPIVKENSIENYVALIIDSTQHRSDKMTLDSILRTTPDFFIIIDEKLDVLEMLPPQNNSSYPVFFALKNKNLATYGGFSEEILNNINKILLKINKEPERTIMYTMQLMTEKGLRIFESTIARFNSNKYIMLMSDITNQEITAAELHAILASLSDLVVIYKADGTCLKVYNCVFPYCPNDSKVNKTIEEIWSPVSPLVGAQLMDALKTTVSTGESTEASFSYLDHKRDKKYHEARFSIINQDLVLCASRDITQTRQMEMIRNLNQSIAELLTSNKDIVDQLNIKVTDEDGI